MDIVNLKIQNFMSIGQARLALDSKGLVLIQGENKDDSSAKSNGAGKSSVPDAISWCLFGETGRGEAGDAIVNRTVGKDTEVSVTLREGPVEVSVTRYRKHKTGKNRLNVTAYRHKEDGSVEETDYTGGTDKLTQQEIIRLIGCSAEVFCSAIYAAQERMPNLPAMTDKQLKELIEEAAGITELQAMHERAKELLKDKEEALTRNRTAIDIRAESLLSNEKLLADAKVSADIWDDKMKEVIDRLTAEVAKIRERYVGVDMAAQAAEYEAQLASITALHDQKRDEAYKPNAEREELERKVSRAERQILEVGTRAKVARDAATKMKDELGKLEALVGTPCGECGKPYHEADLETARKARKASLNVKVGECRVLIEALEKARSEGSELKEQLASLIASQGTDEDRRKELRDIQAQMIKLDNQLNAVKTDIRQIADNNRQIKSLKDQTNPSMFTIDAAVQKIDKIKSEQMALQEERGVLEEDVTLYKSAVQTFSPSGVRAHILDHVTPYLNARTAHYLSLLSDGNLSAMWSTLSTTAKGELRERFAIEVSNTTGGDSFGLLSGGEKRKVRLACSLALQDLVATRATKPIRLYIADEIDDALDAAGLERLMTILDEKSRERGTVLVISHNSLSDWIREVVTVEKQGGLSTVKGSLCPE